MLLNICPVRRGLVVAAALLFASSVAYLAEAAELSIIPEVKTVVDKCLEEIDDPMVCPKPFPTFETCQNPTPNCTVAVVGAAAGGLYTAMRLVDSGKVPANEICIFEMAGRVGGRIYSLRGLGPNNDLVVDIGGYRTWPTFTPTMQALITEYLEYPMECYDDSDPCDKYNLVGEDGYKNGMATWLEDILQSLIDKGTCWYPHHELVKIEKLGEVIDTESTNVQISRQSATLTMDEVALHGTEDDCWSVLFDTVYDLTTLVTNHSGPSGPVIEVCGADGTDAYLEKHGNSNKTQLLLDRISDSIIGPLDLSVANYTTVGKRPTKLYFRNGAEATASFATILNTPQRPLMEIVRNSRLDAAGVLNQEKLEALHSVQTTVSTKLYLYYPKGHTFWLKLGLTSGDYEYPGDAQNMLLAGRYSDGDVRCDDPDDLNTCHGFLLAVYATDFSGNKAQYFRRFQRDRSEVVSFITNHDLEGREFLKHAHARMKHYHMYGISDPPYTGFQVQQVFDATEPPLFAVLGNWNTGIPGIGGAYHGWTNVEKMELAMEPFVEDDIFVVTEAYSTLHGWIEGTIKVADQVLEKYMGVPRPWNFPVSDIEQHNRDTSSDTCSSAGHGEVSHAGDAEPISFFDVTLHSAEDDCWSIIHGDVYDLTEFITAHSGPSGPIKSICGMDGTATYSEHHSKGLLDKIGQYKKAPVQLVPMEDVELHSVEDDCWAVIMDYVYDLTTLVTEHSGPSGPIVEVCGMDGTESYLAKHGNSNKTELLLDRISGSIVGPLGSVAVAVDPFCFTADAMVAMADGSFKTIRDVREGDYVITGTEVGKGLVTEKLIHPIKKRVAVAVVHTDQGALVGTPSHPMLRNGEWVELGSLQYEEDLVVDMTIEFVESFYNLEIDGNVVGNDSMEESSHSYVVNGMVASGLGDNEELNRMYPRQEVWKQLVRKE